ncbi:ABC transporter substrate-binding protein [Modestobacter sp. NPDC049651]|uniref:ABC transporter substrate-binding protein n=1 Tax=unclassified Modestobacter TaxID=2643866 RepID=UPI0033FC1529
MSTPTDRRAAGRPRRALRRSRGLVALGLAAALVSACGSGDDADASASGGSKELDEVTFLNILPLETLSFAPELVADTCGYFADHGLKVKFETTQGSAQAIQTIIADSALVTRVGDIETILAAGGKDAPIVNIGSATKLNTVRFVSSAKDPIESADDLKGRTMGIPSEGGSSEITLNLVENSVGINPDDVPTQVVGVAPGVFDLVQSGRVGGYIVSTDTALALQAQQPDARVWDPSDAISAGGQLYLTGKRQMADKDKADQLKRYMAAVKESTQSIIDDEANGFQKTLDCIAKKYDVPTAKQPDVAKGTLSFYSKAWQADGADELLQTDPKRWKSVYDEMVAAGMIKDGLDPAKWTTDDFAPGK